MTDYDLDCEQDYDLDYEQDLDCEQDYDLDYEQDLDCEQASDDSDRFILTSVHPPQMFEVLRVPDTQPCKVSTWKPRSQQEITRQLETRYREIEREHDRRQRIAALPINAFPCSTCKFRKRIHIWEFKNKRRDWKWGFGCDNKLVIGYEEPFILGESDWAENIPPLCGFEKALWQPRPGPLGFWKQMSLIFLRVLWKVMFLGFPPKNPTIQALLYPEKD